MRIDGYSKGVPAIPTSQVCTAMILALLGTVSLPSMEAAGGGIAQSADRGSVINNRGPSADGLTSRPRSSSRTAIYRSAMATESSSSQKFENLHISITSEGKGGAVGRVRVTYRFDHKKHHAVCKQSCTVKVPVNRRVTLREKPKLLQRGSWTFQRWTITSTNGYHRTSGKQTIHIYTSRKFDVAAIYGFTGPY